MLTDAQGLPVSTDSPTAIAAIDDFTQQMLSYGDRTAAIIPALANDPDSVLLNAHVAALYLFSETANAAALAAPYLTAATQYLHRATERERLYVKAIAAWAAQDFAQAIAHHHTLCQRYPHDLVAAQIGHYHTFNLGQPETILHHIQTILAANVEAPFVYGMLAFALEQCHQLDAAERAGRQAIEIHRCDP